MNDVQGLRSSTIFCERIKIRDVFPNEKIKEDSLLCSTMYRYLFSHTQFTMWLLLTKFKIIDAKKKTTVARTL